MSESWDPKRAARWLAMSEGIERQLAPVSTLLFDAAAIRAGERVLDVGCGTGPTTIEAAALAGPTGRVTGLDLSAELLGAASTRERADGSAPIEWIEANGVTWEPSPASFDVVISRFGVMFFSDPVAAFTNVRRAAADAGRMTIVTWTRREDSGLFDVPYRAAVSVLPAEVVAKAPAPDAGPHSLCDAERIASVLEPSGWTSIEVNVHDLQMPFGGGLGPGDAAVASGELGAVRVMLDTLEPDDPLRAATYAAIEEAFADHVDARGHVVLSGRVLVTTATAG